MACMERGRISIVNNNSQSRVRLVACLKKKVVSAFKSMWL